MIFRIAALFSILLFSISSANAQIPQEYKESLVKFFEVSGSNETYATLFDRAMEKFEEQSPDVPATVWKKLSDDWAKTNLNEWGELMSPIFYKHFTLEELKALITFYETPVGKKWVQLNPAISEEIITAGSAWRENISQKVKDKLREMGY